MHDVLEEWAQHHDELTHDNIGVLHDGERIVSGRNDRVNVRPDDGGVQGEVIKVDDDGWLIVEGTQACSVGRENADHYREIADEYYDGIAEWNGRFAVKPMSPRRPEIDGPLPEE